MNKRNNQTGRSMTEILGVLAVIGVLTVGGLIGYTSATDKLQANRIINNSNLRATHISSQLISGMTGNLDNFGENMDSGVSYTVGKEYAFSKAPEPSDDSFVIIADSVNQNACKEIFRMLNDGNKKIIQKMKKDYKTLIESEDDCEDGVLGLVYNKDMGKTSPTLIGNEDDCVEKNYSWCDTGEGVKCVASENQCCENKECENGTKCVYGKCEGCQEQKLSDNKTYCTRPTDTYACNRWSNSYYKMSCIVCSKEQGVATCPYTGPRTDSGQDTNCVCKGESTACQGSSNCVQCEEGQQVKCNEGEYYTDYCYCAYEDDNTLCAEEGSACIACPEDKTPKCARNGSGDKGCVCTENSNWKCNEQNCVACQEGETPICAGEYGSCYCVPEGGSYKCPSDYGYSCKICGAGETIKCPEATDSEGDYEYYCVCVKSNETAACGYSECQICSGNERAYCDDYGCGCEACPAGEHPLCSSSGGCSCVKDGDSTACSSSTCIGCSTGEALCSSSGTCTCVQPNQVSKCSSKACIACNSNETPICASAGDCYCVPEGGKYQCRAYSCAVCTGTDDPVCSTQNSGSCVCKKENEYAKAGSYQVATCPVNNFVHGSWETEYCTQWHCVPEGYVGVCNGYHCAVCPSNKGGSCDGTFGQCRCNY